MRDCVNDINHKANIPSTLECLGQHGWRTCARDGWVPCAAVATSKAPASSRRATRRRSSAASGSGRGPVLAAWDAVNDARVSLPTCKTRPAADATAGSCIRFTALVVQVDDGVDS